MRGRTSRDGKLSGNVQTVGRYDTTTVKGHGGEQRYPSDRGGESGGQHDEMGNDAIKQVVTEHGPATEHVISKRGGEIQSTLHFEDGHQHEARHDSLDEAHEHGRQAMEDTEGNENNQDQQHISEERDRGETRHGKRESLSFLE
jgi:hypothetical protein